MPNKRIQLIGLGAGGLNTLPSSHRDIVLSADVIFGAKRHFTDIPRNMKTRPWSSNIRNDLEEIKNLNNKKICILATGDPFFYGVGNLVMEFFSIDEVEVLPSPSILSLCCAKIGQNIKDVEVVSLHGRDFNNIDSYLQPNSKLFVLSHDKDTPNKIIELLKSSNFEESTIYIFENIGKNDEKITKEVVKDCPNFKCNNLNSILIDFCMSNKTNVHQNSVGLSEDFFKNDGQITKSEIRAITISKLEPLNKSIIWDIGGGSGSISIEWAKINRDAKIFTIEQDKKRVGYIQENIRRFGIRNITVLHETAPEIFEKLETPNRIFIGGGLSSKNGNEIIKKSIERLCEMGIIVANGVTAETEVLLINMYKVFAGELSKYSVSGLKKIGKLHAWDQQMQVTQWKYKKDSNDR
mgnify:FL=1